MKVLDAIIIGAGPSGLGASIALSGYRPHYEPNCVVEDPHLDMRLREHLEAEPSGLISASKIPALASGLRGRSNNPVALLFDALQHPGVDRGWHSPSCLELRHDAGSAFNFAVVDSAPPGGSWHNMHDATRTLSPGPWMEFPGYPLARYLHERDPGHVTPTAAAAAAQALQPRKTIADYYRAVAAHFDITRHYRNWRVVSIRRTAVHGGEWTIEFANGVAPVRARALILATGTYGIPRQLGIAGESLPFVAHRCAQLDNERTGAHRTVLVVGAGLSAADCIVHLLRRGTSVIHVFRGGAKTTKVGSKFAGSGAHFMYPEYHALTRAKSKASTPSDAAQAAATVSLPLLGGQYSALSHAELAVIHPDGRCELSSSSMSSADEGARPGADMSSDCPH